MRDSRCSNRASFAASASLASISCASCPPSRDLPSCAAICPAWRATTTISSSRDISSGAGTGRSNRTQPITDDRHAHALDTCKIKQYGRGPSG